MQRGLWLIVGVLIVVAIASYVHNPNSLSLSPLNGGPNNPVQVLACGEKKDWDFTAAAGGGVALIKTQTDCYGKTYNTFMNNCNGGKYAVTKEQKQFALEQAQEKALANCRNSYPSGGNFACATEPDCADPSKTRQCQKSYPTITGCSVTDSKITGYLMDLTGNFHDICECFVVASATAKGTAHGGCDTCTAQ